MPVERPIKVTIRKVGTGACLLLVAGYELGVAMAKGHPNVVFLILSIVAVGFRGRLSWQGSRGSDLARS